MVELQWDSERKRPSYHGPAVWHLQRLFLVLLLLYRNLETVGSSAPHYLTPLKWSCRLKQKNNEWLPHNHAQQSRLRTHKFSGFSLKNEPSSPSPHRLPPCRTEGHSMDDQLVDSKENVFINRAVTVLLNIVYFSLTLPPSFCCRKLLINT